jgi:hypothetical protein
MKKPKMVRRPDKHCPHCKGTGMGRFAGNPPEPCHCIAMRLLVKPTDWRGR